MARLLVKLRDYDAIAQTLADCGVSEWTTDLSETRWLGFAVPKGVDAEALRLRLAGHANVLHAIYPPRIQTKATSNAVVADTLVPSNPMLGWHHSQMNNYRAWRLLEEVIGTRGSPLITISVCDTGYEPHPDLPAVPPEDQYWAWPGTYHVYEDGVPTPKTHAAGWGMAPDKILYWFNNDEADGEEEWRIAWDGHGNMCLGIISAKHDAKGVAGVAPGCRARPVSGRVTSTQNWGDLTTDISAEMICAAWVALAAPRVVFSNSWGLTDSPGSPNDDPPGDYAFIKDNAAYAISQGAIIIAAASNDGLDLSLMTVSPAELPGVMSVAAQDGGDGGKTSYSNYGNKADILAPTNCGTAFLAGQTAGSAQFMEGGIAYWSGTGTSSACPATAGAVGLAWSMNPSLSAAQVIDAIYSTVSPFVDADCRDVYFPGPNRYGYGRGVVNSAKAVLKVKSTRAEFSGQVLPYGGFISSGGWTNGQRVYRGSSGYGNTAKPQTVWHDKGGDGAVYTTLDSGVVAEFAAYRNGADVPISHATITAGGVTVYDQETPPAHVTLDTSAWPAGPVAVSLTTAYGIASDGPNDDVGAPRLRVRSVSQIDGESAAIACWRRRNTTVTASCPTAMVAVSYPGAATAQIAVTNPAPGANEVALSDGTGDYLTVTIQGPPRITVNEPMSLGDGRWKLSGTRA